RILKDAAGEPTGMLIDNAEDVILRLLPPATDAERTTALELGAQRSVRLGWTQLQIAGNTFHEVDLLCQLYGQGRIKLRLYDAIYGPGPDVDRLLKDGPAAHGCSDKLPVRGIKLYIDGALGSRGAALLQDYSDDAGNTGLLMMPPRQLQAVARKARRCGVQVATHAIGDRGNRLVLDAYAGALGQDATTLDHRWRIEHAQVLAPVDIARLAQLHVIASMQPTHATSDMPWAEERVGPQRIAGAYAWRQVRDSGARLALGSDFPVESVDPRLGLYAATTRMDVDGKPPGGWRPEEKLTAYEALRGFTLDAAYAGFADNEVGSLAVGKRADFVVLAQDPLAVAPEALRELTVLSTYVDGRPVFQRSP
ncbi:MAG: amidohydrolase, partial [Luteimonas sp.]